MIFDQGDIIKVDFSPTKGHEPKNERPALVVSNFEFNKTTSMTIVCPITKTNNNFFLHEPVPRGYAVQGFVAMEQVRALDLDARGARKIDQMNEHDMQPVLICLKSFFTPDGSSGNKGAT